MTVEVITAVIKIPNYLFTVNGESYTGDYKIVNAPSGITLVGNINDLVPKSLYFRNYLLQSTIYNIPLSETELLSKNFQNSKEKLEKIITFTNSK